MSVEKVRIYLDRWNRGKDVVEMSISTATVELAARALSVIPARIAKGISLRRDGRVPMVVVTAGDMKIDNKKFRGEFGFKPRMLSPEEALEHTGHAIGAFVPLPSRQT